VVEAAEVDVMTTGLKRGVHRREVDAVRGRVDEDVGALECGGERWRIGCVDRCGRGLRMDRDRRGPSPVEVERPQRVDLLRLGEVAHDRGTDRAARPEDRDGCHGA
jgi:hypothetical protein